MSTSSEERSRWAADGKGVVIDFVVADVDEACADLAKRGLEFIEPPRDKPWGLRTASFLDPAGYTLTITSYLPGGKAGPRATVAGRIG